eukprot:3835339-Amphidinium_carterae.1
MWQFYSEHLLHVSECLADMERLGIAVDLDKLQNIKDAAEEDSALHRERFLESMGSVRTEGGKRFNEDLHLMNIGSHTQVRTLLFGGVRNSHDEEQVLERERQFDVNKSLSQAHGQKSLRVRSLSLQPSGRQRDLSES